MAYKSWKWIASYEKARKRYGVAKSKAIANRTIIRRKTRNFGKLI